MGFFKDITSWVPNDVWRGARSGRDGFLDIKTGGAWSRMKYGNRGKGGSISEPYEPGVNSGKGSILLPLVGVVVSLFMKGR